MIKKILDSYYGVKYEPEPLADDVEDVFILDGVKKASNTILKTLFLILTLGFCFFILISSIYGKELPCSIYSLTMSLVGFVIARASYFIGQDH